MQHLNYCRQMTKQFTEKISDPLFPTPNRRILSHCIDLARVSQKFILPIGGRLYDDPEYRALDDREPLRLPFEFIALEYGRPSMVTEGDDALTTKSIVFARERDEAIVMTAVAWFDENKTWAPLPEVAIPKLRYLDRTRRNAGYVGIMMQLADPRIPVDDYGDEARALLCFLNLLQCQNVHVERSEPKGVPRKTKAALPFDTYHVLTIDTKGAACHTSGAGGSGHRSPREHLRRGHIRRLADDRRIWVNATIVAAGRSAGVVTKDYALR